MESIQKWSQETDRYTSISICQSIGGCSDGRVKKISSQRALEYVLLTENSMVVMRGKGVGK